MDQEEAYSQVTDYHIITSIIHLFYKKQNGWSMAQELVNSAVEKPKPSSRTGKNRVVVVPKNGLKTTIHFACGQKLL